MQHFNLVPAPDTDSVIFYLFCMVKFFRQQPGAQASQPPPRRSDRSGGSGEGGGRGSDGNRGRRYRPY